MSNPHSELIREHIEDLSRLRDTAESDGERIRLGESITKALKALREQEEYELKTLREEDFVQATRDLADCFCRSVKEHLKDDDLAASVIIKASEEFKACYSTLKQRKREGD